MKIICVGRNYVKHIEELQNERPSEPVIFIKPDSAVLLKQHPFVIPEFSNDIQIVIGNNGSGKSTLCEAMSILLNASNSHHTHWEEKTSFLKEVPRNEVEDFVFDSKYINMVVKLI
jgi:predicted ATPase